MTIRECYFYDTVALELRQTRLRQFANCTVWTAFQGGKRFLLLDERSRHHTTICEYDSREEFDEDIAYLTNPSGPAAAGVPALPLSPSPARGGGATRPFPPEERD